MTSLSCISDAKINCCKNGNCKDDMCPDTHHCCWQKTENPLLGLCVKKDSRGGTKNCDKKRGLPISSCRDTGNRNRENYEENYEDNNKNLSKIFVESNEGYNGPIFSRSKLLIKILFIFLLILIIYMILNKKS